MRHFLWSKLCEYALLSDYLEAMKPACADYDYDYDYATNVNSFDGTIVSTSCLRAHIKIENVNTTVYGFTVLRILSLTTRWPLQVVAHPFSIGCTIVST